MTLDDITDLLSAQRTGAWADVARRIAHEIKNPLTPIQLSAERLRRRYGPKLEDDFEVFDKSINTILRQVGDIGRMVDEFSSFARMPEAEAGRWPTSARRCARRCSSKASGCPTSTINMDLPEQPLAAYFDQRLISQVLTNLIKNAVEAIEGAGLEAIKEPVITVQVRERGRQGARFGFGQWQGLAEGKPPAPARALHHDAREGHRARARHRRADHRTAWRHGRTDRRRARCQWPGRRLLHLHPAAVVPRRGGRTTSNEQPKPGGGDQCRACRSGQEEPPVMAVEKT